MPGAAGLGSACGEGGLHCCLSSGRLVGEADSVRKDVRFFTPKQQEYKDTKKWGTKSSVLVSEFPEIQSVISEVIEKSLEVDCVKRNTFYLSLSNFKKLVYKVIDIITEFQSCFAVVDPSSLLFSLPYLDVSLLLPPLPVPLSPL